MIKAITERLFVLEVAGATLIIFVGIAVFAKGGYGGNHFGFSHYFSSHPVLLSVFTPVNDGVRMTCEPLVLTGTPDVG